MIYQIDYHFMFGFMVVVLGGMACYNACENEKRKENDRNPSMASYLSLLQFGILLKNPKRSLGCILRLDLVFGLQKRLLQARNGLRLRLQIITFQNI